MALTDEEVRMYGEIERLRLELERHQDALIHIRRARASAGEPDSPIPAHRAALVRQNLRFAAELLER